jgi:xylulokinase
LLIPYFEGERTPNVPAGTGVWFGANRRTHTPAHFARAAMEGATMGLDYGLRRLRELGVRAEEIRLTGGGSNSAAWRRIAAEVFDLPVVCLARSESAAFGAAIQAKWCRERQETADLGIERITDAWVKPIEQTRVLPDPKRVAFYRRLGHLHDQVSAALRDSFDLHRDIVTDSWK